MKRRGIVEALSAGVAAKARQALGRAGTLWNLYGATEASCTRWRCAEDPPGNVRCFFRSDESFPLRTLPN